MVADNNAMYNRAFLQISDKAASSCFANAQFQLSSGGKLKLQLFNNSTRGGKRISFDEGKIFPFNKIFLPLATGRLRLLEMLLCVPCSVFSFGVLTGGVIRHF